MVFQDSSLFPWYTVVDNVAYGLVCQGVPRKEAQRAGAAVHRAGRPARASSRSIPYQLSGGMQQRANLARALRSTRRSC